MIILVITTPIEIFPGLPASGCFIQTKYHLMFIPIHKYVPKHNCASRKQQNYILKSKSHGSLDLQDAYVLLLFIKCANEF